MVCDRFHIKPKLIGKKHAYDDISAKLFSSSKFHKMFKVKYPVSHSVLSKTEERESVRFH